MPEFNGRFSLDFHRLFKPPKQCPTLEEREAGMTVHEEDKNAAVEGGSTEAEYAPENPSAGVGRAPNFQGVIMPPGFSPNGQQSKGAQPSYGGYR